MTTPPTFRPGTVLRYTPVNRWCREGIAVANDNGVPLDTFWSSGEDRIASGTDFEVLFHLDDYDELPRCSRGIWLTYHPDDRQMITSQHGLQRRLFTRKGAVPDHATKVSNARDALEAAEAKARAAQRDVEHAREALAALEAEGVRS